MSATKWSPTDDELDVVARELPAAEPATDRAEQARTMLLANAAATPQRPRRALAPVIVLSAALAVAAALALWFAVRPHGNEAFVERPTPTGDGPKQVVEAIGDAALAKVSDWPDYVVHVDRGRVAVTVAKLEPTERFRVQTADAEVEVRGTRFVVTVEASRLVLVDVKQGVVEVRRPLEPAVTVSAGQRWSPPTKTASADAPVAATPDKVIGYSSNAPDTVATSGAPDTPRDTPATAHAPDKVIGHSSNAHDTLATAGAPDKVIAPDKARNTVATHTPDKAIGHSTNAHDTIATTGAPDKATAPDKAVAHSAAPDQAPPQPGEADFRAGVAALRDGNPARAAKAFSAACSAAADTLAEDACFWVGAAAKRAGDTTTSRAALAAFLARFPASPRAGEAAALLGWILLEAGELDAAAQRFDQAANDRVPRVRESAEKGRDAIRRKRAK